ncbi:MAG: 50S ribosomal protein L7/L12 [Elusimicrobia bacterium]|nr:50S ribosomal protein L7/L12 [Elusimicrobiota bacterium]
MTTKTEGNEAIVDAISKLTVLELAALVKSIEEKFGVKAAPVGVAMTALGAATASGGTAAGGAVTEEKTDYTVVLTSGGDKKIQVIKSVRELTGLGLKEAKDLVEGVPKTIKEGVPKAQAEDWKKKLVESGAAVELK